MRDIDKIYIDRVFVILHGNERTPLFNPSTAEQIGVVRLATSVTSMQRSRPPSASLRNSKRGHATVNDAPREPLSPFDGVKESGIGRDSGVFGLEAFREPRSMLA